MRMLQYCPACGQNASFRFYARGNIHPDELSPEDMRITDHQYGKRWDLIRCTFCGFLTAYPRPSPETIIRLYRSMEDPAYDAEAPHRRRNFLRILQYVEKHLQVSPGRLLDIGAASGLLLQCARERGWDVYGIEPSTHLAARAQARGLPVECTTLEDWDGPSHAFDCITIIDVIEHVLDPESFLKKARLHLRPGGVMCIVTPDGRSMAARLLGRYWWHYRPAHLHFFNFQSLSLLIRRLGGTVIARRRYRWHFSIDYLVSRLHRGQPVQWIPEKIRRWAVPVNLFDSMEMYARWNT